MDKRSFLRARAAPHFLGNNFNFFLKQVPDRSIDSLTKTVLVLADGFSMAFVCGPHFFSGAGYHVDARTTVLVVLSYHCLGYTPVKEFEARYAPPTIFW